MDKIQAINSISAFEVHKILASTKLTDGQKAEFIHKNTAAIKSLAEKEITKAEFQEIMFQRPLIKFRPLKNSFTKQGDDIILAKALNINKKDIKKYINTVIESDFLNTDKDTVEKLKTYVYRHGTKNQVVAFLEYELSDVKNLLQILYNTLGDNMGGIADYFKRPIHRMDNLTMRRMYKAVDESLKKSAESGFISVAKQQETAEWALVRIYQIQNNSRLIRACQAYESLTS